MSSDLSANGAVPPGHRSPLIIGTPVAEFEPRPPRSATYRPDTAVDGWSSARFMVRGASVRGYQHRHDGTPRQDDFAITWHAPTEAVIVAVADGVSAADLAHIGATLACRTAVEQLLRWLDGIGEEGGRAEPDWAEVLCCASWALVDFAGSQSASVSGGGADEPPAARAERLFATTLVVLVLRPNGDGPATVSAARAGDSTAWLLRGREWTVLFAATEPADDVLTTSVTALPRLSSEVDAATVELPPDGVLLVGTDGIGVPVGRGRGPVGAALAEGIESPPTPLDFGYLLDFSRETVDDDRTLVAVWPLGEAEPS